MCHKELSVPPKIINTSYAICLLFIYIYVQIFDFGIYGIPIAKGTAELFGFIIS